MPKVDLELPASRIRVNCLMAITFANRLLVLGCFGIARKSMSQDPANHFKVRYELGVPYHHEIPRGPVPEYVGKPLFHFFYTDPPAFRPLLSEATIH
jgi:hypothetical protein